jgi:tetratricopeptide (TPR) repeat protein
LRLAETCINSCHAAEPSAAASLLREAVSAIEPLIASNARDWRAWHLLGATCSNLANTFRSLGQLDEALTAHTKAIDACEAALSGTPDSLEVRQHCLNAHGAAALTRGSAGRYTEAATDWDRVVELCEEDHRVQYRLHRAIARSQAGEHERAVADLELLLAECPRNENERYNVACCFARAAAAAQIDERLEGADRGLRAEAYSKRALDVLRALRQAGYFQGEKVAQLKNDADLEPLRGLAAFQELVAAVDPEGTP